MGVTERSELDVLFATLTYALNNHHSASASAGPPPVARRRAPSPSPSRRRRALWCVGVATALYT